MVTELQLWGGGVGQWTLWRDVASRGQEEGGKEPKGVVAEDDFPSHQVCLLVCKSESFRSVPTVWCPGV